MTLDSNNYAYYVFSNFVQTGKCLVKAKDIDITTWDSFYEGIMNVIRDGIETEFLHKNFITVDFGDGDVVDLSVFDFYINLIFWYSIIKQGIRVDGRHLHFYESETQDSIKFFLDKYVINVSKKTMDSTLLNGILADTLHKFIQSDEFSMYLANTINLKDTIDLMNSNKEFYDIYHTSLADKPIEDVKDIGMKLANRSIEIIKDSEKYIGYDHCLANSFRAEQGINVRQYKEFAINIGSKPNGQGGVHPAIIDGSYIGGALNNILSQFIDSNSSRVAQIQMKNNTGDSGGFARILGLNNIDSILCPDPTYDCHTHNFEYIEVKNKDVLNLLIDRYYRLDPEGEKFLVTPESDIIGKWVYLRSPMTCASAARGHGVCYKCYGDSAYINANIKPGKYAAENLSAQLTQRQLSAKHLLETMIMALKWFDGVMDYLSVNINLIQLNPKMEYKKGDYLVIDPDMVMSDNQDDYEKSDYLDGDTNTSDYNDYITEAKIVLHDGAIIPIGTEDNSKLYLSKELRTYINKKSIRTEEDMLAVDLYDIYSNYEDFYLFLIQVSNNELSKTLNDIKNLINLKDTVKMYDRNTILQKMLDLIIEGKIHIMSVHLEMILMNQLRNIDNILEKPDWDNTDEPYRLLTLDQALTNNPSVTITMLYKYLSRILYSPLTFKKTEPSHMDLFFMKRPQNFLTDESNIVHETKKNIKFCPVIRYRMDNKDKK